MVSSPHTLRRAYVCPGHAEGNFVETFDRFRLDVEVEASFGGGGVFVPINSLLFPDQAGGADNCTVVAVRCY